MAAAAAVLAAACGDGLSPELRGATLRIYMGNAAFDEQTVAIGEALQLEARVFDATGEWIRGQTAEWSVDDPAVATVDANGRVATHVAGTVEVVARNRVGADTAVINVAPPVTGPVECAAGEEIAIEPGEALGFAGADAVDLCLPGNPDTTAEYALVLTNLGTSAASVLPVRVRAAGTVDVGGPPTPYVVAEAIGLDAAGEDPTFHRRIREVSSSTFVHLLPGGAIAMDSPIAAAVQPAPGDLMTFNTAIAGAPCDAGTPRAGRVKRIGEHSIIVEDTSNPSGGFTDADYAGFAEFFDAEVWPMITATFGTPSDIDGNGRVIIFFTVAVNELPENSNGSTGGLVGGFFFNRDLFPVSSCAGSNRAEMFYLMVPDPDGEPGPTGRRPFSADLVRRRTPNLLVHEFQHLVNDSRRLHVTRSPVWEETWLNEGLSHAAEEMMFFRLADVTTGQNLRGSDLSSTVTRDAFRAFHLDNLDRLTIFLDDPEAASLYGDDVLATRGAAWSFLRYAADRTDGGSSALFGELVKNSRKAGLDNLAAALGADPLVWIRDWSIAIWADDTGFDDDPAHRITSWDNRHVYPELSKLVPFRSDVPYPLHAPRLPSDQAREIALQGGGAGYARATVAAGGRAALRVTVGGSQELPPPGRLKVTVLRIR